MLMNRLESVPLCVKMAKVGAFTLGRDSGGGGLGVTFKHVRIIL